MELVELGRTPISEAAPAGEDARYEPEFEELQAEIDKMSIATAAGGGIDWTRVVTLSSGLLAEKSKNIQVASYLGAGLIETKALEGFAIGLTVMKDLVENFWETMYPPLKRKRGRFNAVTWWMERAEAFFDGFKSEPLDEEEVTALKEGLNALDALLSEKDDEAPMVSRQVRDAVERLPVKPKVAEGEAAAETGGQPAAAAAPAAAPVDTMASDEDARRLLDFAMSQIDKVATYYMEADLANPLSYRLTRLTSWLSVEELPPANGGATLIPPPASDVRNAFDSLWNNKEYESLVQATESWVSQFLFWLDLSRLSAQALDELGGKYGAASEAVALETALYVSRLPGIEKLTFSDGTPFADADTKAWLQTIAIGRGGGGEGPVAGGEDSGGSEVAETFARAQALLKDKKRQEAVKLLQEGLFRGGSGKRKLMWRMALTRLLQSTGRRELARPHFSVMLDQLADYRLEEWDPDLSLTCLKIVYEGLIDDQDDEAQETARVCLDRIARISPVEAMDILK